MPVEALLDLSALCPPPWLELPRHDGSLVGQSWVLMAAAELPPRLVPTRISSLAGMCDSGGAGIQVGMLFLPALPLDLAGVFGFPENGQGLAAHGASPAVKSRKVKVC